MTEYDKRTYRLEHTATALRRSFVVKYRKTDLWISVDRASFNRRMPSVAEEVIRQMWQTMEDYLARDARYVSSLVPYMPSDDAPEIFHRMSRAAATAGIGPMSAVAGACAEHVAARLDEEFGYKEIIIENGGDIYARLSEDIDIAVFAGDSPLSGKVGFHIPATGHGIGICTSSGTVGPSLSFGRADAVMIVCDDVALADSYATAFANKVKSEEDVDGVIDEIASHDDIDGAMIVIGQRMGVTGKYDMKLFDCGS